MENCNEFRESFATMRDGNGNTMTDMRVCKMSANPDGTEYHYSFKIYCGTEAFFVLVKPEDMIDKGKILGVINNDLVDPKGAVETTVTPSTSTSKT